MPRAIVIFAWQVQHFEASSLVEVITRFFFQLLGALKKLSLVAGVLARVLKTNRLWQYWAATDVFSDAGHVL